MRNASRSSAMLTATRVIVTVLIVRGSSWLTRAVSADSVKTTLLVPKLLHSIPAVDTVPTRATRIQARLRFDISYRALRPGLVCSRDLSTINFR